MRVLVLAESCNPEWASLPGVAYKAIRAIAEYADVVVATHIRNRENIEKSDFGRASVRYFDNEYIARPMYKLSMILRGGVATAWTTAVAMSYPSYLAFEWEVWKSMRGEIRRGEFDIIHRITPMSPTLPSPIASWSPVPFVIGPLNGGLRWLPAFRQELIREREWLWYARRMYRSLPYYRSTYRNSDAVLAAFRHTIEDLPEHARKKAINFPEIGIDPGYFHETAEQKTNGRAKTILFVGRFVPYKLPQLVVSAFANRPSLHSHRLVMIGDGPERSSIERLIRQQGLENRIELLGWKSQAEVSAFMRESHIFVFPSIRELGAGVVIEAMACGLACVVVDYGAPGALIGHDRGLKVPPGNKEELIQRLGAALERLVSDETLRSGLGKAARGYAAQYYTWDAKARKMLEVYRWVLGQRSKPDFWTDGNCAGSIG